MNLGKILGSYRFIDGKLYHKEGFHLAITPSNTTNPTAPSFQLIFRCEGHEKHNTRLSGLFSVHGKENIYKGDIRHEGTKERFYIFIDRVKQIATINKSKYGSK